MHDNQRLPDERLPAIRDALAAVRRVLDSPLGFRSTLTAPLAEAEERLAEFISQHDQLALKPRTFLE